MFESSDGEVVLSVSTDNNTVWLSQAQIPELFDKDRSVITRHINNVFREGELEREGNVQIMHIANSDRPVTYYNLDVIISVGYRVKSKRGVEFRRWGSWLPRFGAVWRCARIIPLSFESSADSGMIRTRRRHMDQLAPYGIR